MKFRKSTSLAITLFAAMAITLQLSAQDNPGHRPKHHQYKLIDLGTFGGPNSQTSFVATTLTRAGTIGGAQTPVPDPYDPNCWFLPGCFVAHAFQWSDGVLADLGALPGLNSSYGFAINNNGLVVGISENGSIDPDTGYPEVHAVIWKNGQIADLGTFGGTQSAAENLNNRGQVVGIASNAIPDPFSLGTGVFPVTTQARTFLWEKGTMRDLGTLGGPDAVASVINQGGQVAGQSYTNSTPNPTTGIPTLDPFLWDNGKMTDLGTLGGTIGTSTWINNRGQIVGRSNLAGDMETHGFFWDKGGLTDTGGLGGNYAELNWVNDSGDAVGGAFLPGNMSIHTTLWSHGKLTDLGSVQQDPCAEAWAINASKQLVGISGGSDGHCTAFVTGRAFLWEGDGPMVDLNTLVENPSDLHLYWAVYIDDRGEIVAQGVLPNGNIHATLLIPDGECDDDCEQRIIESRNAPVVQPAASGATLPAFGKPADWRGKPFGRTNPMFGQQPGPEN